MKFDQVSFQSSCEVGPKFASKCKHIICAYCDYYYPTQLSKYFELSA